LAANAAYRLSCNGVFGKIFRSDAFARLEFDHTFPGAASQDFVLKLE
jgi:hypothetical protein